MHVTHLPHITGQKREFFGLVLFCMKSEQWIRHKKEKRKRRKSKLIILHHEPVAEIFLMNIREMQGVGKGTVSGTLKKGCMD